MRDRTAPKRDASNAPQGNAAIEDIPESMLPPFSAEYGTATPGFAEFVARHRFTQDQIAALVKRCENRKA